MRHTPTTFLLLTTPLTNAFIDWWNNPQPTCTRTCNFRCKPFGFRGHDHYEGSGPRAAAFESDCRLGRIGGMVEFNIGCRFFGIRGTPTISVTHACISPPPPPPPPSPAPPSASPPSPFPPPRPPPAGSVYRVSSVGYPASATGGIGGVMTINEVELYADRTCGSRLYHTHIQSRTSSTLSGNHPRQVLNAAALMVLHASDGRSTTEGDIYPDREGKL